MTQITQKLNVQLCIVKMCKPLVPPPALSSTVPAKTEMPNLRQSYNISYIL